LSGRRLSDDEITALLARNNSQRADILFAMSNLGREERCDECWGWMPLCRINHCTDPRCLEKRRIAFMCSGCAAFHQKWERHTTRRVFTRYDYERENAK
jgi:hypothetical protein